MNRLLVAIFVFGMGTLFASATAAEIEISIPAVEATPGESVIIPIMVDKVDNLAGIKLAIKYDKELLAFKKAEKSKHTSPLMHVVNDKNPGKLIVVMAGARGISGNNFNLVTLSFDVAKNAGISERSTQFEISDVQMMSDQLKNLAYKIKVRPLTLKPNTSGKSENAAKLLPAETPTSQGEQYRKSE